MGRQRGREREGRTIKDGTYFISCSAYHQALRFKVWNGIAPVQKSFAKNGLCIADLKGKQQRRRQSRKEGWKERQGGKEVK